MKLIEELCDNINEEIDDAIKYTKLAISIKEEYPTVADAISKIAEEEMKHMSILHTGVVTIIEDYRKKNGEPPEAMMMLYNIMHRKQIEHAAEAKAYQTIYKEQ